MRHIPPKSNPSESSAPSCFADLYCPSSSFQGRAISNHIGSTQPLSKCTDISAPAFHFCPHQCAANTPMRRRFSTGQQALSSRRRVKTRPSLFPRLYQRLAVTAETKDELKGIKLTPTRGGLGMGLQQLSGRPEFASVEKMEALISSRDGMSYQEKVLTSLRQRRFSLWIESILTLSSSCPLGGMAGEVLQCQAPPGWRPACQGTIYRDPGGHHLDLGTAVARKCSQAARRGNWRLNSFHLLHSREGLAVVLS